MFNLEHIARTAQHTAQTLGLRQYDVYGSAVEETGVEVDRGQPKQVQASNRSSVIVRVWNEQGLVGVTSTNDLAEKGLALALATAAEASEFGVTEYIPEFSPEARAPIPPGPDYTVTPTTIGNLIQTLVQAEQDLLAAHEAITAVPYNGISEETVSRFYLNSEGALRQESRSYAAIYLYSRAEQAGKKPRSAGAMKISRSWADLDVQGCLQEVTDKTVSHLHYQAIASGTYRVVFSPRAFLSLLSAFSNLYNAQNILDNQSLATAATLGQAVAVANFCLSDDALHPDNISAETFDGEGTPTRRVDLIRDGVLVGLLHSSGTAKRFNTTPTGHANIGAKITVGAHFYHVFSGGQPQQHLALSEAENVVFIDKLQALHAGVNALQGSFSLPFDGWLVNRGERVSIDAATVAGDFLTLLQSIVYLDSEPEVTPGGICPAIWVDGLAITGE